MDRKTARYDSAIKIVAQEMENVRHAHYLLDYAKTHDKEHEADRAERLAQKISRYDGMAMMVAKLYGMTFAEVERLAIKCCGYGDFDSSEDVWNRLGNRL